MGDTTRNAIERDLARAQQLGRWLSEDELQVAERAEQEALALKQQEASRRTRLVVLTVLCLLIPPLWPLAFGLTLYLLFPRSTSGHRSGRHRAGAGPGGGICCPGGLAVDAGLLNEQV